MFDAGLFGFGFRSCDVSVQSRSSDQVATISENMTLELFPDCEVPPFQLAAVFLPPSFGLQQGLQNVTNTRASIRNAM